MPRFLKIILALIALILFGQRVWAASQDIIISEIMYNPAGSDADAEWVEIYNNGPSAAEIITGSGANSWRFNDGTNHALILIQGAAVLTAQTAAVLASDAETFLQKYPQYSGTLFDTVMSLNNTSDTLKLSADKGESFFGQVSYQNSWGADGDGKSLEYVNSSWIASAVQGGTPGIIAPAGAPPSQDQEQPPAAPPAGAPAPAESEIDPTKIKLSEVYPNPAEGEEEFIEIWNSGNISLSLNNWKLADEAKVIALSDLTLAPGEYKALFYSQTKIALNNGAEAVRLFAPDGNLISEIKYAATSKGMTLAFDAKENRFIWTSSITPNAPNQIILANEPPTARLAISPQPAAPQEKILFSAEESADPDDDRLNYYWTLAGGQKNIFQVSGPKFFYSFPAAGSYLAALIVNDGRHEALATAAVEILPANEIVSLRLQTPPPARLAYGEAVTGGRNENGDSAAKIYLTEIFPNPVGDDSQEWIEIYNAGESGVNLAGWSLDDGDGGSKPYIFPEIVLEPNSFYIIKRETSKIILNNSGDGARLFDPAGTLIASAAYTKSLEGESLARDSDEEWNWTPLATPGAANEFISSVPSYLPEPANSPYSYSGPEQEYLDIDLKNLRELALGSRVRVQGAVAVEPGLLGKTYFYLAGPLRQSSSAASSPGAQIYFSKQDWPALKLGDVVGVLGEIGEAQGETRIKISQKQDLVWLYASAPPEPLEAATGEINESLEGALVKTSAEIMRKNGNAWFIDDGSGEARVVFQDSARIEKPQAASGDWLSVVGLVSQTSAGYRILPRYTADLAKVEPRGEVLGESVQKNNFERFQLPANNYSGQVLRYLAAAASAFTVIAAILLFRLRRHYQKALAAMARGKEEKQE